MEKNKIYGILILSIVFLSIFMIISILPKNKLDKREEFKKFLAQESQKFPYYSEKDMSGISELDRPDMASIQDYFMTLDPVLKRVPRERLKKAYIQTLELRQKSRLKSGKSLLEWEGTQANMGGRARALMFDPNDPAGNIVWTGAVTGGLWYNNDITDANSSWIPVNDFWADLSISCITYDPNDPQIFYVGTGEAQTALITYRSSSGLGMGILKSTDGGDSWDFIESTEGFAYVTDIRVRDEGGQSVVYAAVVSGKYMGEQHQSEPTDGLYRSSDGGENWEQVLPDIPGFDIPYAPSDIEIGVDGRIYVGTMPNLDEEGAATILYSDDGTLGSWTIYEDYKIIIENEPGNNLPGRVMLACAPSDENIIYAEIASGRYDYGLPGFQCYFIIRSENKGSTWNALNIPSNTSWGNWATIAWHALTIGIDPNDPNTVIIGGLDLNKSVDGGNSWTRISDWTKMYSGGGDDYVHADMHSVIYKQGSSDEAIFSTDGGVFYTASASDNYPVFEEINKDFNSLQCYSGAVSPVADEVTYLSGHQDNGTVLWTGEAVTINDMITGGDGAYCFFDKNEPEIFITSYQNNRYYIFVNGVQVAYLTQYGSGNFICPADYDYNLNILYANAAFFWSYNLNKILRISGIPNDPEGEFLTLPTGVGATFTHVKYSPYSPAGTSTLFLGTQAGNMFKVENVNTTPIITDIGSPDFPTATVSCIAIGGSEDTLLVTFSNYGVSSVWQTYDGGNIWEEKEGNLPDMPVRWAIYQPQNSSMALLATEIGVWSTNNLHEDEVYWEPAIDGLANVRVDMLKLRDSDNTVLAATHGRGLFTTNYEYNPVSITEHTGIDFQIYPNPTHDYVNLQLSVKEKQNIIITINDVNGRTVFTEKHLILPGDFTKRINMSDYAKGTYFIKVQKDNNIKILKIVKL